MSKHTPGPWRVEENTTLVWGDCSVDGDEVINLGAPVAMALGSPHWRPNIIDDDMRVANARLIAAAPDLLDVLQQAVAHNRFVEGPDWWERVEAAIAKATGEKP